MRRKLAHYSRTSGGLGALTSNTLSIFDWCVSKVLIRKDPVFLFYFFQKKFDAQVGTVSPTTLKTQVSFVHPVGTYVQGSNLSID